MQKFLAGKFRPYYLPPPYTFELTFENYEQADRSAIFPGVTRIGERGVRYESADFAEGWKTSYILLRLRNDTLELLTRILNHDPAGKKYLQQLEDLRWQRSLDPDGIPDWAQPDPRPAEKTLYWGDN
jgi:hypothetical protein